MIKFKDFNPDVMEIDELMDFWMHTNPPLPVAAAREFFGELASRPRYVEVFKDLGAYAANKATAMRQRLAGEIETALEYERICDRIYSELPLWARW